MIDDDTLIAIKTISYWLNISICSIWCDHISIIYYVYYKNADWFLNDIFISRWLNCFYLWRSSPIYFEFIYDICRFYSWIFQSLSCNFNLSHSVQRCFLFSSGLCSCIFLFNLTFSPFFFLVVIDFCVCVFFLFLMNRLKGAHSNSKVWTFIFLSVVIIAKSYLCSAEKEREKKNIGQLVFLVATRVGACSVLPVANWILHKIN